MKTPKGQWPNVWPGLLNRSLDYYGTAVYADAADDLLAWILRRSNSLTKRQESAVLKLELLGIRSRKDAEAVALILAHLRHRGCWMIIHAQRDILQTGDHYPSEHTLRRWHKDAREAAGHVLVATITLGSAGCAVPDLHAPVTLEDLI